MYLVGADERSCDRKDGGSVALNDIAGNSIEGPVCQVVTAGSYWIAKGAKHDAQEGHWTVAETYCGG